MKLKILGIKDAGRLQDERVLLEAEDDGNVGLFVVLVSKVVEEKKVSSLLRNPYWFPDKDVKKGDLIVLYSRGGSYNAIDNKDASKSHFFYIGSTQPLYQDDADCVIVMESNPWCYSSKRI